MEIIGVGVIVIGALFASVIYLKESIRKRLGRSILLGLEFLVAADIINTVGIKPTMESVLRCHRDHQDVFKFLDRSGAGEEASLAKIMVSFDRLPF